MRCRVRPATEAGLVDYASHGVGASSEVASLIFPDVRVKDSPDAGDQRLEGPVGTDDDVAFGKSNSWRLNQSAGSPKEEASLSDSEALKPTRIRTSAAR